MRTKEMPRHGEWNGAVLDFPLFDNLKAGGASTRPTNGMSENVRCLDDAILFSSKKRNRRSVSILGVRQ